MHGPSGSAKKRKRFFEDSNGVAASFANKISLAYFLGIIGSRTREDLDRCVPFGTGSRTPLAI